MRASCLRNAKKHIPTDNGVLMKYRIAIISIFVFSAMLFIIAWQEYFFVNQVYNSALTFKKNYLRDSVNNLVQDIDTNLENGTHFFDYTAENMYMEISHLLKESSDPAYAVQDYFSRVPKRSMWGYVLFSQENEVLLRSDTLEEWVGAESSLPAFFCTTKTLSIASVRLVYGVLQTYLDSMVESFFYEKLHKQRFADDAYMWINKVLNYDGGDDYAIRLVHPSIPDTEGLKLSTAMQDIRGNYPYAAELAGVKKDGECFNMYYFKETESDDVSLKLTYSTLYKRYDWIISMGVYMGDIDHTIAQSSSPLQLLLLRFTVPAGFLVLLLYIIALIFHVYQLQKKRKAKTDALINRANWDSLTNANTRVFGEDELSHTYLNFRQGFPSPAIMLLNIENLKEIVAEHGDETGNTILRGVAECLHLSCRTSDLIIRWHHASFLGIFFGMKLEFCAGFAAKIQQLIKDHRFVADGRALDVHVVLGFSFFRSDDENYKDAVNRATQAQAAVSDGQNYIL